MAFETRAQPPEMVFLDLRYFETTTSPGFAAWLIEQQVSIAFTNSGARLMFVGVRPDDSLATIDCGFDYCLGLTAATTDTLYMVTRFQIWRLQNALRIGEQAEGGYDRLYIPQSAYTTGNVAIQDIAVDQQGRVLFISTLCNCLATTSDTQNFQPLWKPRFISDLAATDRCHLSGLAMRNGQPAYVTSTSQTNEPGGWQTRRRTDGIVIDLVTDEIVLDNLSMPASPRIYRDQLWVLNAGTGYVGTVDLVHGRFEPLILCPGIPHGLCFVNDFAIIGVSKPRDDDIYAGLDIGDNLRRAGVAPRCGLMVVDLRSGRVAHWLYLEGKSTREVFDIVVLPQVRLPKAITFGTEDIQQMVTIGPFGAL